MPRGSCKQAATVRPRQMSLCAVLTAPPDVVPSYRRSRSVFMPLTFLFMWVTGLLSLAVLGAGIYIPWAWYQGEIQSQIWLTIGILMLLWSAASRSLAGLFRRRGA